MEPGIHSLSFDQYLGADGVSGSMLNILGTKTPAHLKLYIDGVRDDETPAKRFGTIAHRALFEPETLKGSFHVRPDWVDGRRTDGKAWISEHKDLPVISEEEAASVTQLTKAIHSHPVAGRLMRNAEFEKSVFVKDSSGTLRKFRPDILPHAGNVLPDLKTVDDASPEAFEKKIWNFGWFKKAAYYLDNCKMIGREFDKFVFIAAEKGTGFIAVYALDAQAVEAGRMFYQRDLAIYRKCLDSGNWPGYSETVNLISLPEWAMRRIEGII